VDPQEQRFNFFNAMLPHADALLVIMPTRRRDTVSDVLERSLRRAHGLEPGGVCVETPESRAALLEKVVLNYDVNADGLKWLLRLADALNVRAFAGTQDELFEKALAV
jgi:hypothetical protein